MSLTLILILLVTVTVVAAPAGLAESSPFSSSSDDTHVPGAGAAAAARRLRREGSVIPPTLDRHNQRRDRRPQRLVGEEEEAVGRRPGPDVMAATVPNARAKTWPQLVGMDAEEAKQKILAEHPTLQVQIVPQGGIVSMDYNVRRVRIYKNEQQKVATPPRLG